LAELTQTVETQQDQLRRYEGRLRDLVRAYKSLQNEKEALEVSVKALSSQASDEAHEDESLGPTGSRPELDTHDAGHCSETEKTDSEAELVTAGDTSDTGASDIEDSKQISSPITQHSQRTLHLKNQVATLSNALTAITNEKKQMEVSFQRDKKLAKEEKDELMAQLAAEQLTKASELEAAKKEVQELRTKLRTQQLGREQEQNDHVVMLSELQTLLTQERRMKEMLNQKLEEEISEKRKLQTAIQAQEAMAAFRSRQNKHEDDKPSVWPAMNDSTINVETHPSVIKMKKEWHDSRGQLQRMLQQERARAKELEDQLINITTNSEEVACSYEDRISELSATVGTYERLRVQDQCSIETLKDELEKRISIHSTKSFHAKPIERLPPLGADLDATVSSKTTLVFNESLSEDPYYLLSKMKELKTKIEVISTSPYRDTDNSDTPSVPEMVTTLFDKIELDEIYLDCTNKLTEKNCEINQLKDQIRAVTIQAKLESPVKISFEENDRLKTKINLLEDEMMNIQNQKQQQERLFKFQVDKLKEEMFLMEKEIDKVKLEEQEKWKGKLDDVMKEMKKQRDRTMAMLKQKDVEVDLARVEAVDSASRERAYSRSSSIRSRHNSVVVDEFRCGSVEPPGVLLGSEQGRELESALNPGDIALSSQTVHVACREALARVEADLRLARRRQADAETSFRKLQNSTSLNVEDYCDEINRLKEEIERLGRNQERSSHLTGEQNMEYLKNVVFRLIISRDSASKLQLIPVIATILHFSLEEKQKALAKYQSWWGSATIS